MAFRSFDDEKWRKWYRETTTWLRDETKHCGTECRYGIIVSGCYYVQRVCSTSKGKGKVHHRPGHEGSEAE